MNISVKSEYALLAIFDLACQNPSVPVKIAEIAQRQKIPQKFLELILASLKQGGFVTSRRGADGGYLLARRPDLISVGQVLRFVEGEKGAATRKRGADPFRRLWNSLDLEIAKIVDSTSFRGLVREWQEQQSNYTPNWDI